MSELLIPQAFEVILPSHRGMPEGEQPVFTFQARTWRETIELDEITSKFREHQTDGPIAELIAPAIKKYLLPKKSADINKLTWLELVELFVCMRECEKIELNAKKNSVLQSLSDEEKSAEPDAETAADPNRSSSTVPIAEERAAPDVAAEEDLT